MAVAAQAGLERALTWTRAVEQLVFFDARNPLSNFMFCMFVAGTALYAMALLH